MLQNTKYLLGNSQIHLYYNVAMEDNNFHYFTMRLLDRVDYRLRSFQGLKKDLAAFAAFKISLKHT